jgi:hypothetical protein
MRPFLPAASGQPNDDKLRRMADAEDQVQGGVAAGCYDHKPERLPPIELAASLVKGPVEHSIRSQAAATIRDLQDENTSHVNAWGRVTQLLGIPWDASAGKACEEIRKLQKTIADVRGLAVTAAIECPFTDNALFERLAEIERVCG